jgi:hypothetical protein
MEEKETFWHGSWNCHGQIQLASYMAKVFIKDSDSAICSSS